MISITLICSLLLLGCSSIPKDTQVAQDIPTTSSEPPSISTSSNSQETSDLPDASLQPETPTSINPNCGNIIGNVSYFDDSPASGVMVSLFKVGSTTSDYWVHTDLTGKYTWSNIPVGNYEIYTGIYRLDSPVSFISGISTDQNLLPPDAMIKVFDQQTIEVEQIIIPKEITHIYAEDFSPRVDITDPSQDVIITPPSSFSWESIPLATNYSVLFRPLNYKAANYADSIFVTTPSITSPSVLPPYYYYLIIRAFDEQRRLVGVGIGFFEIK